MLGRAPGHVSAGLRQCGAHIAGAAGTGCLKADAHPLGGWWRTRHRVPHFTQASMSAQMVRAQLAATAASSSLGAAETPPEPGTVLKVFSAAE